MDLNEMRRRFKEQRAQSKDNGQLADNSEKTIIGSMSSNIESGNATQPSLSNSSKHDGGWTNNESSDNYILNSIISALLQRVDKQFNSIISALLQRVDKQ